MLSGTAEIGALVSLAELPWPVTIGFTTIPIQIFRLIAQVLERLVLFYSLKRGAVQQRYRLRNLRGSKGAGVETHVELALCGHDITWTENGEAGKTT